jgi:transcriptional regulator with XRE-family HTH domain
MNLKEARKAKGWTQKQTAARVGCDRLTYGLIETGKCLPTPKTAASMLHEFGGAVGGLFPEYDDLLTAAAETAQKGGFSQQTNELIELISIGKENAVSREYLREATGWNDRLVRRRIAEARKAGLLIVNDQDGNGYYFANNIDEVRKQYKRDRARALSILARLQTARKILKTEDEQ